MNGVSEAQRAVFRRAAETWQNVITGDLPDIPRANLEAGLCETRQPTFSGFIDDIVIFVDVRPIDGPSKLLGRAGPCLTRSGSGSLPLYGIMVFDSADSQGVLFPTTVLHEMGHVLGVGTLWTPKALVNYTSTFCPVAPRFTGSRALNEWQDLGGSGTVPVEEDNGPGTACGHWDEQVFDHELMTGFIESAGKTNPLSRLTVASLQDVGYKVDLDAAESYSLPECRPNCTGRASISLQGVNLAHQEEIMLPIGEVAVDGTFEIHTERSNSQR